MLSNQNYRSAYDRLLAKLRAARIELDLTQVQVATLLGRGQPFVSKIESGERRLDFVELQMLAQILRKPVSFFQDEDFIGA